VTARLVVVIHARIQEHGAVRPRFSQGSPHALSVLDLVVIGVVVISALLAAVRGFTREVLAIGAWVAAGAAAWFLHPMVLPLVKPYIKSDTVALAAAIGGIFILTLIIVLDHHGARSRT
jgi:hypothetical protein